MSNSAKHHRLGDLQLRILQALWAQGETPVTGMHALLEPERHLAPTTIATMLRKMEARGLVTHREEGRTFLYRALVSSDEVSRTAGQHFVERLFEGSLTNAVSHLLQSREVSREELQQLDRLIKAAKRRAK